jgi:hypothetical protein
MKQNVVTSFFDTDRAINMQSIIEKLNQSDWIVKQVATACIDREKRPEHSKPSIAITLLLEKPE